MMANPIKQMPYQPIGDLRLEHPGHAEVSNYRRELNLDTAIARISYTAGGITFGREIFASPVDQVIVVNLTADHPGQINFAASFATLQRAVIETAAGALILRGENRDASGVKGALKFQARAMLMANAGKMCPPVPPAAIRTLMFCLPASAGLRTLRLLPMHYFFLNLALASGTLRDVQKYADGD